VHDLVNQPERVDLPCAHDLLRETKEVALLVHLLRKEPRRVKVGKEDVAGK